MVENQYPAVVAVRQLQGQTRLRAMKGGDYDVLTRTGKISTTPKSTVVAAVCPPLRPRKPTKARQILSRLHRCVDANTYVPQRWDHRDAVVA